MRSLVVNAAPVPYALKQEVIARFGDGFLFEVYGSTELGVDAVLPPEDQLARPGSCGKALPGVELRVVDDEGAELPAGEPGVLQVRSPTTFSGYHGREQLADGWKSVGDIAHLDADGYVYIRDRPGDLVITGGMNVYPAEVEAVLHEHPDVLDAAVYGLPSPEWGETVHAVVVPRDGHALAIPRWRRTSRSGSPTTSGPAPGRCAPRCRAPSRASSSNASCAPNTTFRGKGIPRSAPGVRSLVVTLAPDAQGFPRSAACCGSGGGLRGGGGAGRPAARAVGARCPQLAAAAPTPTPAADRARPRARPRHVRPPRGRADLPRRGRPRPGPAASSRRWPTGAPPSRCWRSARGSRSTRTRPSSSPTTATSWATTPGATRRSRALTTAAVRSEIERCRDRIAALTGGPGAFFRPSAAQHATARGAAARGRRRVPHRAVLRRRLPRLHRPRRRPRSAALSRAATAGSVVSMHLGHPGTLAALPGLLDDLAAPRTHPGHRERPVPLIPNEKSARAAARPPVLVCAVLCAVLAALAACAAPRPRRAPAAAATPAPAVVPTVQRGSRGCRPSATRTTSTPTRARHALATRRKAARPMVYVPHTKTGEVWTIDPATFAVVGRYRLGGELQHVVPVVGHDARSTRATTPATSSRRSTRAPACPASRSR